MNWFLVLNFHLVRLSFSPGAEGEPLDIGPRRKKYLAQKIEST